MSTKQQVFKKLLTAYEQALEEIHLFYESANTGAVGEKEESTKNIANNKETIENFLIEYNAAE